MKKKIMAVTLCLAMVSTFAVGCGQKNETDSGKSEEKSSGKVEIEFVQVKREAAESYTKVIEAFEKENPDIVIKQNVVPDAQEVLMTRASSDSLPDMMNHWPTDAQFVQFEDEGLLLDLSEKDYMKNIDSKYLDAVKAKDGKNYIAPYNVNFMGVYYNKDTVGAGDVFHGAFLAAIVKGLSPKDAARFASGVAAIKCTRIGGRAGIPNWEVTDNFLETGEIDYREIDERVKKYGRGIEYV